MSALEMNTTQITDAAAAVAWYAVSLTVVYVAWRTARRAFPVDGPSQWAMHTLTFVWSWIVLTSFILGAFGILGAVGLGAGVLLLAFGSHAWFPTSSASVVDMSEKEAVAADDAIARRLYGLIWSVAAALGGAVIIVRGLTRFPSDWDTLMYHRPLIDHWLQQGTLYAPGDAVWYNPGNAELFGLWWAAPFSGDFWVGVVNVPSVLLMALGTYELGRVLKLGAAFRHTAALAAVSSSVVVIQIADAENDIAVGGLFVSAVAYGCRYVQGQYRQGDLILAGACLGLLTGVKYYALGYVCVAWLGIVTMAGLYGGWRRASQAAVALAGLTATFGGFWYARNLLVTGTPFYPIGYSGEATATAAVQRSPWSSSLLGNGRLDLWPQYLHAVWDRIGIFHAVALVALPLSLTWLAATRPTLRTNAFASSRAVQIRGALVLVLVLLGSLLVLTVIPFTVDRDDHRVIKTYDVLRFSQPVLLLLPVAFGVFLSDVSGLIRGTCDKVNARRLLSAAIPALFATTAAAQFYFTSVKALQEDRFAILLIAVNLLLAVALLREFRAFVVTSRIKSMPLVRVFFVAVGLTGFVVSSVALSVWWHGNFSAHYDREFRAPVFSDLEQGGSSVSRIAAIYYCYYPFFGSRRQFQACRPRRIPSEDFLLEYLASGNFDFVAVIRYDPFKNGRYERVSEWVQKHPDVFDRTHTADEVDVYYVKHNSLKQKLVQKAECNHGSKKAAVPIVGVGGNGGV